MIDRILRHPSLKGIDRRGFLKRGAWAGALLFCSLGGGVLSSPSRRLPASPLRPLPGVTNTSTIQGQPTLARMGAAPASSAAAAKHQVSIDNFSFTPKTLTVPVGATVTWINHDDVPHTVVDTQKRFASPALDTDEKFSHQFRKPGKYHYFCSVHPMMTGTVVVK